MNTKDLHAIWNAPDNSRLTAKQYTVRLPIRVAAQLAALSEMYPRKTKTELIGDLLAAALDQLAEDLPTTNIEDRPLGWDDNGEPGWEQKGPGVTFARLVKKYLKEFETEGPAGDDAGLPMEQKNSQVRRRENRRTKK
ncbi:MAG: hypothetical protein NW701_06655 [Nitrospira sp.]